jgi:acyl-CoA hydrolase
VPSTACQGQVSRITATLTPGSIVTTSKNSVDHVVTEHGVADMRGRTLAQRAQALIGVADPRFRDDLSAQARRLGYL